MERRNAIDAERVWELREAAKAAVARRDRKRRQEDARREQQRQAEHQRRLEGVHPCKEHGDMDGDNNKIDNNELKC